MKTTMRAFAVALVLISAAALPLAAAARPLYANTIVVAKSGGDFSNPRLALASITNATPTNRVLVKIMPGTYDLGNTAGLAVPENVDVEGSGQSNTVLRGGNLIDFVTTFPGSSVKSLTVDNTFVGGGAVSVRMLSGSVLEKVSLARNVAGVDDTSFTGIMAGGDTVIRDVIVSCSTTSTITENVGIWIGGETNLEISNTKIWMSGGASAMGIYAYTVGSTAGTSVTIDVVNADVLVQNAARVTGIAARAGSMRIVGSRVVASNGSQLSFGLETYRNDSGYAVTTQVSNSELRAAGPGALGVRSFLRDSDRLFVNNTLIEGAVWDGSSAGSLVKPKLLNCFDPQLDTIASP